MKKIQNLITALINTLSPFRQSQKSNALQPVPVSVVPSFIQAAGKNRSVSFIAGALILLMVSVSFSSCFTSGYGCKGRSRCITRVS